MSRMKSQIGAGVVLLAAALAPLCARALQISSFSPQGEVARVRQVVAKFDAAAVNSGDPKAPAPVALSCSDATATRGTGRWTGEREWVFDFERDLPPGVRCTATVKPGFKSAAGAELTGAKSYQFNSGGPFVQTIRPGTYEPVDEEQFFVLQLNGAATTARNIRRPHPSWGAATCCAWPTTRARCSWRRWRRSYDRDVRM